MNDFDRERRQRPERSRWDTLRSIKDLGSLALDEIVQILPIKINFSDLDHDKPQKDK